MKKKSKSLKKNGVSMQPAVLLIGWGREGVKDITAARKQFPYDKGMGCIDARGAGSADVLELIEEWLTDNPNAQFLYIGSHGNETELVPIAKSTLGTPKIRWATLGAALSKAKRPITLWLGACSSTFAAEGWKTGPTRAISLIVGFNGDTFTHTVMNALQELLQRSNAQHRDTGQETDITFLPDDLIELPQKYPGITMHFRVKDHGFVDCSRFQETIGMELHNYLDDNCNNAEVADLFHDVLRGLAIPAIKDPTKKENRPPCKNLGVQRLKPKKRRK